MPGAKYTTAEELAHPTPETSKNSGRQRYTTSKLANVMWAYALHRRFAQASGKSQTVTLLHPGLMPGTGLAREASATLRFIWIHILPRLVPLLGRFNIHSPQDSGAALASLALSPDVEGVNGAYYEGRKKINLSTESYDEKKQEELWDWTVRNIAMNKEEARKFHIIA
jgi:NAD(P)-dependent dehydrogenase (short-subunit alcohol dehydrogenase family)